MKNRRIKKPVIYVTYSIALALLFSSIYLIEKNFNTKTFKESTDGNLTYVSKVIFDDTVSVVSTEKTLSRPYTDSNVVIAKSYYDYKAESESQERSIIYYENTYMQSSGVSYSNKEAFEVVAVYDGTVIAVSEDDLLGNIVQIKHSDNVISVYQSLSTVNVKVNDVVSKGNIIGTSGNSNLQKDLEHHLYFELIVNNENVNPENYYDKSLNEI